MKGMQSPLGLALVSVLIGGIVMVAASLVRYAAPDLLTEAGTSVLAAPRTTPVLSTGLFDTENDPETEPALGAPVAAQVQPTFKPTLTPSPEPTATETAIPTATPTLTPLPTPTPAPVYQAAQPYVELTGFTNVWQTWNNCGPATLSMNLSYYGGIVGQAEIAAIIKPNPDDKNVSPEELVTYARSQGYHAQLRVNGNRDLLRTLVSNNIPVIIETWLEPEPNDGMGHYRMIVGYDDAAQTWIGYDSYYKDRWVSTDDRYRGIYMPYAETDALWRVFNNTYVLVYPDNQAPLVQAILGAELDETVMWQNALQQAQLIVEQNPADPFAWFNLGTDRVALGDYEGAAYAYDQALAIGLPWRMHWYQFGALQAYYGVGRYDSVIALADTTLAVTATLEEHYYWRGLALAGLGDIGGAQWSLERALALHTGYTQAQEALTALSQPQ